MPPFLHLLGPPRVGHDGSSADLPFERRHQLLAYLAVKGTWVPRAELASLLWPDHAPKLANANLRKTLFRMQELPWAAGLQVEPTALRFEAGTDVRAFDGACRDRDAAAALRWPAMDFLPGYDQPDAEAWTDWLSFERARLRTAWRSLALERLAGDLDVGEAGDLTTRLLEADPIDEDAVRAQMALLARTGQPAAARAAYRAFAQRLERDWGLLPGSELKALHESIAAPAATRAPRAGIGDPGFVGRGTELRDLADRLSQPDCRLVCILGPGGVGKTRLARQALATLQDRYEDGTVFVGLEDITQAADAAHRFARDLGVRQGHGDALQAVIAHLQPRQVLLAADNLEQVPGIGELLATLLRECPRLQVVATSRRRLEIAGEWTLDLEGLPCPDDEDADRIEAFDAVRLFLRTALRVAPGLQAGAESHAIIDICRQVEGLPLALELAAAWTRVLSCEAIASELRGGTELLRALNAQHPARHASLEVVFDQSWALLGDVEREALARLSVFRGGFTAEAALAVAGARLPVLAALVDRSLLRKEGGRLSLHPMIQQLAAMRLEAADAFATEEAHAQYFLRLLGQSSMASGSGDRAVLASIEADFENCREAWSWAAAQGELGMLVRASNSLRNVCDHRGRAREGIALLREALDANPDGAVPAFAPRLRSALSHLQYRLDQYEQAIATATVALGEADRAGEAEAQRQCSIVLAACHLCLGQLDAAREWFQRTIDALPGAIFPAQVARLMDNLALVEKRSGRFDESKRMSLEALERFRRLGDTAAEALCRNNLAALQCALGENEAALAHLQAALQLCDQHGLEFTRSYVTANLADATLAVGDVGASQRWSTAALEVGRRTGNRTVEATGHLGLARVAVRRGVLDTARAELATAAGIVGRVGGPSLQFETGIVLAQVLAAQGQPAAAAALLRQAATDPAADSIVRLHAASAARDLALPEAPPCRLPAAEVVQRAEAEAPQMYAPLLAALA